MVIGMVHGHFLSGDLPFLRTDIAQPAREGLVVRVRYDVEKGFPDDLRLGIAQYLLLPFIDGNDGPRGTHHNNRIGHEVEQGLVAGLRDRQLLRTLRHRLFQPNGIPLDLLLQPTPFGHISDKSTRVNQPASLLIEQRSPMNLHIHQPAILGQQHCFHRAVPV